MPDLSEAEREALREALRLDVETGTLSESVWRAARDYYYTDPLECWTCMSCGVIGDAQSCGACGAGARPGRWVLAEQAEARERALREALERIDAGIPSEEHWHRMGDSMWANIGRAAAKAARSVLAASPQPDHEPRSVLGRWEGQTASLGSQATLSQRSRCECAALEHPGGSPDDMVERGAEGMALPHPLTSWSVEGQALLRRQSRVCLEAALFPGEDER
jgi:hypothetical protein